MSQLSLSRCRVVLRSLPGLESLPERRPVPLPVPGLVLASAVAAGHAAAASHAERPLPVLAEPAAGRPPDGRVADTVVGTAAGTSVAGRTSEPGSANRRSWAGTPPGLTPRQTSRARPPATPFQPRPSRKPPRSPAFAWRCLRHPCRSRQESFPTAMRFYPTGLYLGRAVQIHNPSVDLTLHA